MSHTRRNALVAIAMSAAVVGTGIGLGVSSAGAATAAHQTAAAHHAGRQREKRASPAAASRVSLTREDLGQLVQDRLRHELVLVGEEPVRQDVRDLYPHGPGSSSGAPPGADPRHRRARSGCSSAGPGTGAPRGGGGDRGAAARWPGNAVSGARPVQG